MIPALHTCTLAIETLSIGAAKRKAPALSASHFGLSSDSSAAVRLVALSRLLQVRDESILTSAAATPIGTALLNAIHSALLRIAVKGGATAALSEASVATFWNLSASTIANRHLYDGGLSLPTALPWRRAKALLAVLLESVGGARTTSDGARLASKLMQVPSPPLDETADVLIAATMAIVESAMAARLDEGSAAPSSSAGSEPTASDAASGSSTPPPLPPLPPLPSLPPQAPPPFEIDATTSLAINIQRLVVAARRRPLDEAEGAAVKRGLDDALAVLQAGGTSQRRALLDDNVTVTMATTSGAMLWACAVDAAETPLHSTEAFATTIVERCSAMAAVLFAAAVGL